MIQVQAAVPKPARPEPENLIIPQLSPELEHILKQWEIRSADIKTLHGKHQRTEYNLVFEVEKRSRGEFWVETPDKGRIEIVGVPPKKGDKSQRIGKSGNPFRVEEDRAQKWICDGKSVIAVNDEEKTYETVEIPPEERGANIINSPLPFLFGLKAVEMKRRFHLELKKETKTETAELAYLIAIPRTLQDKVNYERAMIILDKKTYIPTAVKLFDPSQNLETVYVFEEVKINDKSFKKKLTDIFSGDPFAPNLRRQGYKEILKPVQEIDDSTPRNPVDPRQKGTSQRPIAPGNTQAAPRTGSNANGSNQK